MISFSKVKSSIITKGARILKILQLGVKTANESAPFGDDSCPVKEMTAIYADTLESGEPVIIGYINETQLAAEGEKRLYSLKADGSISFFVWLRNNGTIEIGGSADNAVRYQKLDDGLQSQKDKINIELGKIATAITALGGAYAKQDISIDVSAAKIDEIKVL